MVTDHQAPVPKPLARPIGGPDAVTPFAGLRTRLRLWGPLIALILLCLVFGVADPGFLTLQNLQTIANRSAIPVILAVGMTFIILQGSIYLSIEGVMAASSLAFETPTRRPCGDQAAPL